MVSWNADLGVGGAKRAAKVALIKSLAAEGVDLVALQEVRPGALDGLTGGGDGFAHGFIAPSPTGEKPKASAILVSQRLRPLGPARTLPPNAVPAPHKAISVRLEHEAGFELAIASFHVPPGSQYGREEKRDTFRAIARWMAKQPARTLVGIDANSPETDAYCDEHGPTCLCQVRYFPGNLLGPAHGRRFGDPLRVERDRWRFDQEEHLLHDPASAPRSALRHNLADAYRAYLAADAAAAKRARAHYHTTSREQGHGCLASSHLNRDKKRRFDFIYATPDLKPVKVEYRNARAVLGKSEHAMVAATFELA